MRVPAKNPFCPLLPRKLQRTLRHFRRHPQPSRVQPVNQPCNRFAFEIQLLQFQVQRCSCLAQPHAVHLEAVELVPVNRKVLPLPASPRVMLVNPHAHQVRHDVRQPVVVIALHPHHLDLPFRVRELADVAEKFPVIFRQTGEIKVGKNIAQQNQSPEAAFLQDPRRFSRAARLCTQVQVGKDQRVVDKRIHIFFVAAAC